MKSIEEMIAVMTAYKEGKAIQCANVGMDDWDDWENPSWNWDSFDYRVKTELKIRPYANAKEFLAAQKEHGPYLYNIKHYSIPICVGARGIMFEEIEFTYSELLNFEWQDGTPCCIVEEGGDE